MIMEARCTHHLWGPDAGSFAGVGKNRWVIRRATAEDGSFLADMLVEATNLSADWKKEKPPPGALGACDGALHRRLAT